MVTRDPPTSKKALAAARREREIAAASALIAVLDPDGRRSDQALISAALDAVLGALGQRQRPGKPTTTTKTTKTAQCHDLSLTLVAPWPMPDEEQPACSRRIHLKVGPRMTLWHLHDAIQSAFSWEDRHLAAFSDAVEAKFEQGVLHVFVPRPAGQAKPASRITIKAPG